jgi:acyl-CoA synthetase (NDP forming)
MKSTFDLKPFFEPRSVAVIGASRTLGKAGNTIVKNTVDLEFKGRVYPVNPNASEILGLKTYPSLESVPEIPDLVLIAVPPESVPDTVKQSIDKRVKSVVIESGGFSEVSKEGAEIEKTMVEMANDAGMRVMGPNSIGTVNTSNNFACGFAPMPRKLRRGSAAFVAQSGLFSSTFIPMMEADIGVSKISCIGNKSDIDETDLLEYLSYDQDTKVICMYIESIKRGHHFMKIARETLKEKPIIILKSGRTELGAKAASSHTGSLAGRDEVYDAMFKQLGIIRVKDFEELFDMAETFVHQPLLKGNCLAVVSITGAGCVTASDACAENGIELTSLSQETFRKLKKIYPQWAVVRNPVDIWTAIETSGFITTYKIATQCVMEDENVDAAVIVAAAVGGFEKDILNVFSDIKNESFKKPIFLVASLGNRIVYDRISRSLQEMGISPPYLSAERAIKAAAALYRYSKLKKQLQGGK